MLNSKSVKTRFLVSVFANVARAGLGFLSGLLIARGLRPVGYGDFTFLLGSFAAIKSLLDMGSSSAFYTFISRHARGRKFFLLYFGWMSLQFAVTSIAVYFIMPQSLLDRVWVGHGRDIILLAFAASFMQQQVWQTVNQIGESTRQTVRLQSLGMTIACAHLALTSFLCYKNQLSVYSLFLILIAEYLAAVLLFLAFRQRHQPAAPIAESATVTQIVAEFSHYCRPLVMLSLVSFLGEFADRWMLQRFGGSGQQGFYQIAYQFSAVSLLATTSILNVFWKEIAEAHGRGDVEKVERLYLKVNRGLVLLGAVLSGFLIPWTTEIVNVFLGQAYLSAVPVLIIMFLYPIHQSMGQIGGTMLLASGHTRSYMKISVLVILASIPLSYLVQAPVSGAIIPGLGLGAIGMSIKTVLVNIVSVNIQAYVIARICRWKYDWIFQPVGIIALVGIGFAAKVLMNLVFPPGQILSKAGLVPPLVLYTTVYSVFVALLIWALPWLAGMDRESLRRGLLKLKRQEV